MENIFKGVNAIFYSIHFHELMFPTGSSMSFSCATIFCPGRGSPGPFEGSNFDTMQQNNHF